MMASYVALLRGINVGGRNPVRMEVLANHFRSAGYEEVRTHLQSGNVLFASEPQDSADLEGALDRVLQQWLDAPIPTIVRSRDELATTIASAPSDIGSAKLRSEVFFLKEPLTVETVTAQMPELRAGVDSWEAGDRVFYFSRLAAQATRTRITRLMNMPVFQQMTVRSWRTTTRLLELLDSR